MISTITMTASVATYPYPRAQATTSARKYGRVKKTFLIPKAPEGARYCEEVNAMVPADLPYRIRGISIEPRKKTLVERLLRKEFKEDGEPLVIAMGLTHGKMELISLGEAQQSRDIVYRSVEKLDDGENFGRGFRTDLISLGEAKRRPEIVYRGLV
ncbi:hypothetical protein EW026_g5371 [Hermanssonia centrifuga]|uniref:Uncharacterized protein n=1 Tax=Hermanssonia centrifuga TaxID=98765 RepID=A0A4S4KEI8_9APHY|nr:hypothetical protein EW026_g5371 [Hermanssonia centrifuga]